MARKDLSGLKHYKYSAVDKSPLSYYILTPYWQFCTNLLPLWVAPNLITLTGLGFIVANVFSILVLLPDLKGPGPAWLYYSFAAGLFIYQTADNMDGKQARRTGSSSALGELFDHGIDSLNCTLGGIVLCSAMGFGATRDGAVIMIISSWPMFFSSWEQFHTGTLYLGYFNGPTEGILIACGCMLVSAIWGPGIWQQPLAALFPILQGLVKSQTLLKDAFMLMTYSALFFVHIPFCIYNVYLARSARGLDTASTLLQWLPLGLFTGAAAAWIGSPYGTILRDNHMILFGVLCCLVFGRMTTKIILAHLLRQPFPLFTVQLVPLLLGAAIVNAPMLGVQLISAEQEVKLLWLCLGVSTVMYVSWAEHVIRDFTTYLGISCLTIPYADSRKRDLLA
ncbi:CDP-alcohol phosphatidyltransferase-domain-containing protein [Protomyces lactucae-debilis]|uniref:CDP-alcohol phosphatidyltransferase-domain-containing protein n=1 Tax=Protomyces lactucae-debilis TaxID=2754530 RepID=A0A1Y2FAE8_PROLT|nr:CDP-alcohol phosphatidyltransferase-domain-containing protein [Protomyces lactucae-debilis]ORY80424.1 CDP-alcohol phosphatidyltransferase-domain-containing protein [Protomyces lactucae-debilis]